jgi:hypothetical protein
MLELNIAEKRAKMAELGLDENGKPLGAAAPGAPGAPNPYPDRASPKAGDDEKKTTYLIDRIVNNTKLIKPGASAQGGAEWAASKVPGIGQDAAAVARSGPRQSAYQSQVDTIDALLTLATGAAYTKEQFASAMQSYMPTYLDKPEAVADKERRLAGVVQAAKNRAGRAWTMESERAVRKLFQNPELLGAEPDGSTAAPPAGAAGAPATKGYSDPGKEERYRAWKAQNGIQ